MTAYAKLLKRIRDKTAVIGVIGLGYIGLPTALFYRRAGFTIYGIDTNKELVDELKEGKIRMKEEGLEKIAEKYLSEIKVGTSYEGISEIDVFVLCLPSPIDEEGKPVVRYLENSVRDIANRVKKECLLLVESTVPVGTTEKLAEIFRDVNGKKLDHDFWFAHCPERVLPGKVVEEMNSNHRLAGGVTNASTELAVAFLNTVFHAELIHATRSRISETAKLAENAFRDANIAYANELAKFCTVLEIDVTEVIQLANLHPRVDILNPGLGVGGYCLPKDGWILVESVRPFGEEGILIPAARQVNDSMPAHVSKRIRETVLDMSLRPTIGILGLSFKPDVSDTRNSPALDLIKLLGFTGMEVVVYDPMVFEKHGDKKVESLEEVLASCDVLVLGAAHQILKKELQNKDLSQKVFVDPHGTMIDIATQVRKYIGLSV
ncbi:MAG: nucleotide sugar dehydrogenase [Candidatus Thorarchaeota archaeon]|nr:nucleotide sugar dehydrogenase [Candidatus Thorarchaeota archaeon]